MADGTTCAAVLARRAHRLFLAFLIVGGTNDAPRTLLHTNSELFPQEPPHTLAAVFSMFIYGREENTASVSPEFPFGLAPAVADVPGGETRRVVPRDEREDAPEASARAEHASAEISSSHDLCGSACEATTASATTTSATTNAAAAFIHGALRRIGHELESGRAK